MSDPHESEPAPGAAGKAIALGLAGAVAGGVLGFLAVGWLARQGFYGIALPGVLLGTGANWATRRLPTPLPLAILCALLGLGLSMTAEWRNFPFLADPGLGYFLSHLEDLRPASWAMILLSGFAGFYFTWRKRPRPA